MRNVCHWGGAGALGRAFKTEIGQKLSHNPGWTVESKPWLEHAKKQIRDGDHHHKTQMEKHRAARQAEMNVLV